MQPTAKPKPAPKLRSRHSIQDLHSSPHATASSAPHPPAAQPRSAEHAPTLATGAPVGVRMLTHPLRPPPPLNQPKAQPAPILARGGLPVMQPSPLFVWFADNACIQHMASRCTHQQKHASIGGVQGSSGQYLSTLTAEYPASLAASLIKRCAFKVSTQPEIRRLNKPSPLSLHPVRLRVCDGAGLHSTADHSIPQPNHPLTIVARAWLHWLNEQKLIPTILAHVGSGNASPPLSEQQSEEAARIAFRAMSMPCPSELAPDEGQPCRLSLLHALATASNDPDLKLVPLLAEGVPTGAVSELPRSGRQNPRQTCLVNSPSASATGRPLKQNQKQCPPC